MSGANGNGKSRLDRIEEILERHSTMLIGVDERLERQNAMLDRHSAMLDRHSAILDRHATMAVDFDVRHQAAMDRIDERLDRHRTTIADFEVRHQAAMDRIDASIERQILANEAAHERFEAEDKRLLTAQVLMNGALEKMALAMEETTDKLNGLIDIVDGFRKKADGNGKKE
jgi:hypothetical protein